MFLITKKIKTKEIYCVICIKYRKFENPEISNEKILLLSNIWSKCENGDEKREEKSIKILKIFDLVNNL